MQDILFDGNCYVKASPESQGVESSAIQNFLDAAREHRIDLHALYIFRHGYNLAAGVAAPCEKDAYHRIYSAAKVITGIAALFAIQEGLISFEDKLIDFFPDEIPAELNDNIKAVNIYHLLTMSIGQTDDAFPKMIQENRNCIPSFFEKPFVRKPGTVFMYNNAVPHVLNMIIERVSGVDYMEYLRPRFFEPVGCKYLVQETLDGEKESATCVCTPDSLVRTTLFLAQRGMWGGRQLIKPELIDMLGESQIPSVSVDYPFNSPSHGYGYGFQVWRNNFGGYRISGGRGQYGIVIPELDLVIVAMAWESSSALIPELLAEHIISRMYGAPVEENEENKQSYLSLSQQLEEWSLGPCGLSASSAKSGKFSRQSFLLEKSVYQMEKIRFDFSQALPEIRISTEGNELVFKCGLDCKWNINPDSEFIRMPPRRNEHMPVNYGYKTKEVYLTGGWEDDDIFVFQVRTNYCMSYDTFTCRFRGTSLTVTVVNAERAQGEFRKVDEKMIDAPPVTVINGRKI